MDGHLPRRNRVSSSEASDCYKSQLALLIAGGIDPKFIQLTAPTGKAADRMKEAVNQASTSLGQDLQAHLQAASNSSKTIHSLLGQHPGKNSCTYHHGHRLPCKVLIVD